MSDDEHILIEISQEDQEALSAARRARHLLKRLGYDLRGIDHLVSWVKARVDERMVIMEGEPPEVDLSGGEE